MFDEEIRIVKYKKTDAYGGDYFYIVPRITYKNDEFTAISHTIDYYSRINLDDFKVSFLTSSESIESAKKLIKIRIKNLKDSIAILEKSLDKEILDGDE